MSGTSLRVSSNAYAQTGLFSSKVVDANTQYLHLDVFRAEGSGGTLMISHGSGWTATRLDASNYGTLWTIDGVASSSGLASLPAGAWSHVVVNLGALVGVGNAFQALSVFGDANGADTYYFDNIQLVAGASLGVSPPPAFESGATAVFEGNGMDANDIAFAANTHGPDFVFANADGKAEVSDSVPDGPEPEIRLLAAHDLMFEFGAPAGAAFAGRVDLDAVVIDHAVRALPDWTHGEFSFAADEDAGIHIVDALQVLVMPEPDGWAF